MDSEKIFYELRDFIDKSWFYDNEEPDCRLIRVDYLLNFIEWLEKGE